ncbi:MAG: autotransporter outer membrane beta-barrel domain-containing protein [Endomicrobium sp.]|uniref:autotransporter outer membrane beta-barrel domain-containing protein n=1 Tax=Candidatus Endomicrobiellum pyrsonymphae TaxID=1408203 RepID=UPI0035774FBA|nr:autotransporter outer membrane beta-barrel domain-containing protein [Endomicrobium sp.]
MIKKGQDKVDELKKAYPKLRLSADDIKDLKLIYKDPNLATGGTKEAVLAQFIKRVVKIKTSGYLANVIRSGGSENDSKEIFARINNRTKGWKSGVWAQVSVARTKYSKDDNSLGDYTDTQNGGFIGYDKYIAQEDLPEKLMLGVYTKVNGHNISQGSTDEGKITDTGAGVYGSYEEEKWQVKAIIGGSYDAYNNNKRELEISVSQLDSVNKKLVKAKDFAGYGIGCNLEGALKVKLSNKFKLKPYFGLDARRSYYDSIKEESSDEELRVNTGAGNYNRSFAKTGLVIEQKINKFGWNVNAEYRRLLSNNLPKIVSAYTYSGDYACGSAYKTITEKEVADIGTEEDRDVLGAGVGGNYNITKNVSVFANIDILIAKGYQNMKANLGASYRF